MERYFAKIINNIVVRVIVAGPEFASKLPGLWLECGNKSGRMRCGTGWFYSFKKDDFYPPQPYPSWHLNRKLEWKAPNHYPRGKKVYDWDEEKKKWVLSKE